MCWQVEMDAANQKKGKPQLQLRCTHSALARKLMLAAHAWAANAVSQGGVEIVSLQGKGETWEATASSWRDAAKSGHLTAELLARGLSRLQRPVQLFIAYMEPGKEERTMAEVAVACGAYRPEQLQQGQQFVF